MDFDSHFGCSRAPRANGPDRLVGDDYTGKVLCSQILEAIFELRLNHWGCLASLPLGEHFAYADNRNQICRQCRQGLSPHRLVRFPKILPALRVTNNRIATTQVGQHCGRDFTSKGALLFPKDILTGDLDVTPGCGTDCVTQARECRSNDDVAMV